MVEVRPGTMRRAALVAGALLLVTIVVLAALYVPHALREIHALREAKDRVAAEDGLAKTVLQVLGGAALLVGLYFTSRTLQVSQQGQITDRFNDAIEHLGDEALAVRLGGIYALARIGADSERDAVVIVEILCSFVREAAARTEEATGAEVRAILSVLGTAAWARDARKDLRGCVFRGLDVERLDLRRSVLDDASFVDCRLACTRFNGSSLRAANLQEAYLRDSSFKDCDVTAARFAGAYLRNASFDGAEIIGAKFDDASLLGARFTGAKHAIRQQFETAVTDGTTVMPEFQTVIPVVETPSAGNGARAEGHL